MNEQGRRFRVPSIDQGWATITAAIIALVGSYFLLSPTSNPDITTIEPTLSSTRTIVTAIVSDPISVTIPHPTCLLIGDWEAQIPGNNFQVNIDWNAIDNHFEGKVIRVGERAGGLGSKVGDLVYVANLSREAGIIAEKSRVISGPGNYSWKQASVDINTWVTADVAVFFDGHTMNRINNSRLASCR